MLEFPGGYGTPYVAYDQQGLVFAAATSTGKANIIKLYDARNVRLLNDSGGCVRASWCSCVTRGTTPVDFIEGIRHDGLWT